MLVRETCACWAAHNVLVVGNSKSKMLLCALREGSLGHCYVGPVVSGNIWSKTRLERGQSLIALLHNPQNTSM